MARIGRELQELLNVANIDARQALFEVGQLTLCKSGNYASAVPT